MVAFFHIIYKSNSLALYCIHIKEVKGKFSLFIQGSKKMDYLRILWNLKPHNWHLKVQQST